MTHKFRKFRSWFRRGAVTRQRPAADTPSSPAPPRERYCTAACPDLTLARPAMAAPLHSTLCLYSSIVGEDCHCKNMTFQLPEACSQHWLQLLAAALSLSPHNNNPIIRNYLWQSWILLTRTARRLQAITIPHLYGATNYWLERSDWNFMFYRILYTPYLESTSLIIFPCFPWRMVMSCSRICFSFFLNTGFSWWEPKRCLK